MIPNYRSYSDVEFFTEGVTVDICVMQNGRYTACASGYTDHDLPSAIVASPSSPSSASVGGQPLSSSTSFAGQQLSESDRTFERFDTNKDGKVSLIELKIGLEKELSGEYYEYSTISLHTIERLMYDYDESGDEALQRYEFVSVDTFSDRLDSYHAGLAGWAVALIVIFCLLFVCCMGYAVGVVCCGVPNCFNYCFYHDEHDNEKTKSMSYLDDNTTTRVVHVISLLMTVHALQRLLYQMYSLLRMVVGTVPRHVVVVVQLLKSLMKIRCLP